jgi:four helix bundle protein
MLPYERFEAWRRAHELVIAIYTATRRWPQEERYGLVSQIRRAVFSVASNIAEGSAKHGNAEFRRYLDICIGSLSEVSYALRVALDIGIIGKEEFTSLDALRNHAGIAVWKLYKSMGPREKH